MGGEMLYILQQRLQAQTIPTDKSERGTALPSTPPRHSSTLTQPNSLSRLPPSALSRSAVLQDVVSTMFAQKFIDELFRPERVYAAGITRQIFDRLGECCVDTVCGGVRI